MVTLSCKASFALNNALAQTSSLYTLSIYTLNLHSIFDLHTSSPNPLGLDTNFNTTSGTIPILRQQKDWVGGWI